MKTRRIIFLLFIIINCITIFYFSNQEASISSQSSKKIVTVLMETIPDLNHNFHLTETIVRKIAHISLYMLLGFFNMNFALTYRRNNYQRGLFSCFFAVLYAASDEIHQTFINGRSGELIDVCIDSIGALMGIIIALLIIKIIRKIFKTKQIKHKIDENTRILFISSTGGHFSELMQLRPIMKKCKFHIVTEKTKTNTNLKEKYKNKINFLLYETKRHPLRYMFVLLINCFYSLYIYLLFRPEIIITTGTHTAAPMCCIGKILGSKVIFIETFANRNTKTVTGRILYHIADTFIVQWEEMKELYPKSKNFGWIY